MSFRKILLEEILFCLWHLLISTFKDLQDDAIEFNFLFIQRFPPHQVHKKGMQKALREVGVQTAHLLFSSLKDRDQFQSFIEFLEQFFILHPCLSRQQYVTNRPTEGASHLLAVLRNIQKTFKVNFMEAALNEWVVSIAAKSVEDEWGLPIETHVEEIFASSAQDAVSIFFIYWPIVQQFLHVWGGFGNVFEFLIFLTIELLKTPFILFLFFFLLQHLSRLLEDKFYLIFSPVFRRQIQQNLLILLQFGKL